MRRSQAPKSPSCSQADIAGVMFGLVGSGKQSPTHTASGLRETLAISICKVGGTYKLKANRGKNVRNGGGGTDGKGGRMLMGPQGLVPVVFIVNGSPATQSRGEPHTRGSIMRKGQINLVL